ncbi:hypothetical protein SAMN03159382_01536 [Pseudomonas sp. NFACC23-1]|nr:hypothetical protein SAMN03159382_01536 [Pseudomonas sp. NFACC23-1]
MVQRGYLGIHAEVPTAQYLRSASVVNGAPRSTSTARRPYSRPGLGWTHSSCGSALAPTRGALLSFEPALFNHSKNIRHILDHDPGDVGDGIDVGLG